jgi:nucleotide-binding universal stress UspA family protein
MYQRIVVGTDGSDGASVAVENAIELARLSGATLHVVLAHKVLNTYQLATSAEAGVMPINVTETNDATHAGGQRICDEVVRRAAAAGVHAEAHCMGGDPADALISIAKDVGANVIVVGNRGMSGKKRLVLGSVPNKVSHHSPCNLLIVDTSRTRG